MNRKRFFGILLSICLLCSSIPVTVSSAATAISDVSITVTEPVIGAKPSTAASVPENAKYYVKEVTWGSVKTFRANVVYGVSILLAVKDGVNAQFKASNGNINASVNGKQAEWYNSSYQPGKELYVKYAFPAMKGTAVSKKSVAVSSEKDLKKMSDNPEGSYYLTKDITVSKNTQVFDDFSDGAAFTGTLDGKGHRIKGYAANVTAAASEYPRVSLFGNTKDATFKNLTLSGVDIRVKSDSGALVSALCNGSAKCSKVTIAGKISVSGNADTDEADCEVYGFCRNGTFKNCTNKANISADYKVNFGCGSFVTGIAKFGTFKDSRNTGTLSSKGSRNASNADSLGVAGISVSGTLTNCKNTGTVKTEGKASAVYAAGVSHNPSKVSRCSNSGKVSARNTIKAKTYAAGVANIVSLGTGKSCGKCCNSGTVSIIQQNGSFYCGGVFANASGLARECYNTGKVSVKALKSTGQHVGEIGGVVGNAYRISECYNTGRVSANMDCDIGGVAGMSAAWEKWTVIHCYNTGKVSAKKGCKNVGGILGCYTNNKGTAIGKYYVYDNYSITSPIYGTSTISGAAYRARGKKVSSVSKKNCTKLSSKYWTYSKKHKRLILKNVKEK